MLEEQAHLARCGGGDKAGDHVGAAAERVPVLLHNAHGTRQLRRPIRVPHNRRFVVEVPLLHLRADRMQ